MMKKANASFSMRRAQAPVHGGNAARVRAEVWQLRHVVPDDHGYAGGSGAQHGFFAVYTGRPHGVRDQSDGVRALDAQCQQHGLPWNVASVADEFNGHIVAQVGRLHNAGINQTVLLVERRTGIVEMRHMGKSPVKGPQCLRRGRRTVCQRSQNPVFRHDLGKQLHIRQLRRGVPAQDASLRPPQYPLQILPLRDTLLPNGLCALGGSGEIGALQMQSQQLRAVFRLLVRFQKQVDGLFQQ